MQLHDRIPLEIITTKETNAILQRGHYLGALGYEPYFCISTPARDAVAVFSPPVPHQFRDKLHKPLDLSRLWQAPGVARLNPTGTDSKGRTHSDGGLSQFLGAVLRVMKKQVSPESDCIFSYADPDALHRGIIYQATNWAYLGPSRTIDVCADKNGNLVPLTVCYRLYRTKGREQLTGTKTFLANWGTREKPDWRETKGPGLTWIEGLPKHLYLYGLKKTPADVLKIIGENGRYKKIFAYPR